MDSDEIVKDFGPIGSGRIASNIPVNGASSKTSQPQNLESVLSHHSHRVHFCDDEKFCSNRHNESGSAKSSSAQSEASSDWHNENPMLRSLSFHPSFTKMKTLKTIEDDYNEEVENIETFAEPDPNQGNFWDDGLASLKDEIERICKCKAAKVLVKK
jgi:hypothetical protein